MSSKISNGLISLSSPLINKVEEQSTKLIEKQCIVSIPGSETEQTKAASLRRRDLSPLGHRSSSSSPSEKEEEEEEEECELDKKEEFENPKNLYVWSSILLSDQKPNESVDPSKSTPPPYVPPPVKKTSKSSPMSEKSLRVCTESLGSETGSYEFQAEEEEEEEALQLPKPKPNPQSFDGGLLKYQYHYYKHTTSSSFPPPLPSLYHNEHSSLHYHSQRNNGRLVLQAVSVPNLRNCFHSQRLHGRLVLTFEEEEEDEEEEEKMDDQEEETEGLETEEGIENEAVNLVEELGVPSPIPQKSLLLLFPPRVVARLEPLLPATVAATTSFNACEYFWRNKATTRVTTVLNPIPQKCPPLIKKYHCTDKIIVSNSRVKGNEQQEMVVLKGNVKGDCLLPLLRSCCCLEPGRPLLIWEPYCIATS